MGLFESFDFMEVETTRRYNKLLLKDLSWKYGEKEKKRKGVNMMFVFHFDNIYYKLWETESCLKYFVEVIGCGKCLPVPSR